MSLVSDLAAAGIPQLMGLPVYEASAMTTATTSGSFVLVACDLAAYRIADSVAGLSLEYVPVIMDQATGRPNGTRGWVYHQRTGADLLDTTQGRILKA